MLNVERGDSRYQGERCTAVFTATPGTCNDACAPLSRRLSGHNRGLSSVSAPRRCNSRSALALSSVRALYSLTNACNSAASASVNVPSLFLACSHAKRPCTSNGKQYAAAARSSWTAMVADGTGPDIVQCLSGAGLVTAFMIPLKAWCVKHPIRVIQFSKLALSLARETRSALRPRSGAREGEGEGHFQPAPAPSPQPAPPRGAREP